MNSRKSPLPFHLKHLDHLVLTTSKPHQMVEFYSHLGFEAQEQNGSYRLTCPNFMIKLHVEGHELLPHAAHPVKGAGDFCIAIESASPLEEIAVLLSQKGLFIEEGPVERNGCFGKMNSIYLRDPEGNLVELCVYPKA